VTAKAGRVADAGTYTVRGTVRKQNEDRFDLQTEWSNGINAAAAVYDGHGGAAVAEWLQQNFFPVIEGTWATSPERDIGQAFVQADETLLQPKGGFFGAFGERGVGGSKCGATCALAMVIKGQGGKPQLLSANAGDARVILARGGKGVQLSEDHTPDVEAERKRIERTNPNPKMPLVRFVGDTWRTGGVLALSRAFGDAYLKGSAQFEGVPSGSDGYSSGFGLTAEPHIVVEDLKDGDSWVIVCSDGLCGNVQRGAGGGLTNDQIAKLANEVGKKGTAEDVAEALAAKAQEAGSTDDVTVVALKLG
jgi:protein phosphatase 1K